MADSNPSVELAPLKDTFILDLDEFTKSVEEVEEKVTRLGALFKICFNPEINIDFSNFNESIDEAIKQAERLDDVVDSIENKRVNIDIEINEPSLKDIESKFPVGDNISPFEHFGNIDDQIQQIKKALEDEIKYKDTLDMLNDIFPGAKGNQNLNEVNSEIKNLNENLKDLSATSEGVVSNEDEVTEAFNNVGEAAQETISKIDNLTEEQIKSANALREANKSYVSALGFDIGSIFDDEQEEEQDQQQEIHQEIRILRGFNDEDYDYENNKKEKSPFYERTGERGEKMLDKGMMGIWTIQSYVDKVDKSLLKLGFTSQSALNMANREFGKNSTIITQWSKNAVTKMGLSSGEALSMADMFGMSALSMGANKTQAIGLAERLTALAQNITVATGGQIKLSSATQILTQMLGGSMYGLKDLGVSFSKTQENAEAAALGFGKSYKALSPLQKAFVDTTLAQNGLSKSLGSLNGNLNTSYGQWLKCKSQLEENAEVMMEQLMPYFLKLMKAVTNLVIWFSKLGSTSHILTAAFLGVVTVVSPLLLFFGALFKSIGYVTHAFKYLSKVCGISGKDVQEIADKAKAAGKDIEETGHGIKRFTSFLDDSGKAMEDGISILGRIGSKFKGIGTIALRIGKVITSGIFRIGEVLLEWASRVPEIIGMVVDAIDPVTAVISVVALAIAGLAYAWHKNLWNIKTYTIDGLNYIKEEFHKWHMDLDNLGSYIEDKTKKVGHACLVGVIDGLKAIGLAIYNNPIIHQLIKVGASILYFLGSLEVAIGRIVIAICEAVWHRATSLFTYLWNLSKEQFDLILGIFKSFGDWAENIAINTFNNLKNSFENGLHTLKSSWDSSWHTIGSIFDEVGASISSYCAPFWDSISTSFDNGLATIKSSWDSSWTHISNIFSHVGSEIGNYMSNMWSDWIHMAESQLSFMGNIVHQAWSAITGWFNSVIGEPAKIVFDSIGQMIDAGENFIMGLLHGLENGWYKVTNWISDKFMNLGNEVSSEASNIVNDITGWGDGSHATGLTYVPWDGYRAELHAGEMVLTKEQATAYRNGTNGSGGNVYNFYSPKPIDPFEAKRQLENANRRMANGFS